MDNKERAHKYFSLVYAALIILGLSVGAFMYSLLKTTPEDLSPVVLKATENGTPAVNPSGMVFPDGPPSFPDPMSPPSGM